MILATLDYSEVTALIISGLVLAVLCSPSFWRHVGKPFGLTCSSMLSLARQNRQNSADIALLRVEVRTTGEQNAISIDQNKIILDALDIAYMQTDARGNVNAVSDAWCDLAGKQRDDVLRDGWTGLVAPQDQREVLEVLADAVANGRSRTTEFTFDDNKQVARLSTSPIRHGGQVIAHRIIFKGLFIDKPAFVTG